MKIIIFLIRVYQKIVSPFLKNHCRFHPCCSEYSLLAIQKHGFLKGGFLSFWRILKCNPFCKGGFDLP